MLPKELSSDETHVKQIGSSSNGMQLSSECLLEQLLTPFLPGCDQARDALGAPLLNARLYPMGAYGVHDQRH
jgi:hypothetical protein